MPTVKALLVRAGRLLGDAFVEERIGALSHCR
jgi:hypothetical protein